MKGFFLLSRKFNSSKLKAGRILHNLDILRDKLRVISVNVVVASVTSFEEKYLFPKLVWILNKIIQLPTVH
jgi:hypothetical protein